MDISDDYLTSSQQQNPEHTRLLDNFLSELNSGYTNGTPLGSIVTKMTEAGLTQIERNHLILQSDYMKDTKIRDAITMFGFR